MEMDQEVDKVDVSDGGSRGSARVSHYQMVGQHPKEILSVPLRPAGDLRRLLRSPMRPYCSVRAGSSIHLWETSVWQTRAKWTGCRTDEWSRLVEGEPGVDACPSRRARLKCRSESESQER